MSFLNEVLELEKFITSPVRMLSLGQRMRADIAASMLHSPKVLFLDEPISHLDDDNSRIMGELIIAEAKAQGAGVIATSIGKHIELPYNHTLQL